ncbi:hypothetical protein BDZ45DRAFT_688556 [Acephala macrosclerotiorum]|nr:hypothetical protein BDZ45DRAFT_688556 [Acephala macrosclerotiorum]
MCHGNRLKARDAQKNLDIDCTAVVLSIDGACRDNGKSSARASIGVFHGSGSEQYLVSAFFARLSLSRSVDCGFHDISQLGGLAASMLLTGSSSIKETTKRKAEIESPSSGAENGPEIFGPRLCRPASINQRYSVSSRQNSSAPAPSMPPYTAITDAQSSILDSWPSDATMDVILQIDTAFDPCWESQWETTNLMLQDIDENVNQRPDEPNNSDMNMVC